MSEPIKDPVQTDPTPTPVPADPAPKPAQAPPPADPAPKPKTAVDPKPATELEDTSGDAQLLTAAKEKMLSVYAESAAVQLSVPEERIPYILKLADLSDIKVGEDLSIDTAAVKVDGKLIYDYDGDFFSLHPSANRITIQNNYASPMRPAGKITGTLVYQDNYY